MTKKIMIIDDEKDITEMYKMRLEANGYRVVTLNSSQNALQEVKRQRPDLILLDIMMPEKDGYIVRDEVKSDEEVREIPLIFFTAKQSEHEVQKDAESTYEVEGYVMKPINSDALMNKIKEVLGG